MTCQCYTLEAVDTNCRVEMGGTGGLESSGEEEEEGNLWRRRDPSCTRLATRTSPLATQQLKDNTSSSEVRVARADLLTPEVHLEEMKQDEEGVAKVM